MSDIAMILGAGRGTRLASMGLTIPKVLVDVAGRPLLDRQIDYLFREGITRVVVNAYHLAEAIESFAREYRGPVELAVVKEPRLLGTAGGVRNALDLFGTQPFFILYGDVVIDQPLAAIAHVHRERSPAVTIAVYETSDIKGKGTVRVDDDGWITGFAEKRGLTPGPALANAGLYLAEPRFLWDIPESGESDFGYDVFPAALKRGDRLLAYRLAQPVIDVGTPDGLDAARQRLAGRAE